ncbi:MAG: rhomboid family intramembrane serine protease [Candidatus Stahlbacteria bacterium]|nr:rhomboid family intramembrane serine protease [Candidatus Stahlbacteria bacterium]
MFPLKTDASSTRWSVCTILFILLNIILFIYEATLGGTAQTFIRQYGAIPYEITHFVDTKPYINFPIYFTLLTSIFLHGSWIHLLGNMWFLFIFGRNVEDWLGHSRFILFYLVCGIGASTAQIIFSPFSRIPTIGASGAIAGVLGGYFVLYPRTKVLCLVPVFFFIRFINLPAFIFLGIWIIWQVFSQLTVGPFSNIAFWAHIGGFFIGLFWIRWLKSRSWR